jgi:hypothetical protein
LAKQIFIQWVYGIIVLDLSPVTVVIINGIYRWDLMKEDVFLICL